MTRAVPTRRPRGISLLELVVVTGIAVLLGGVILALNLDQLRSFRRAQARSEIEQATRQAIRRVVKVIRDATPSSTGGYPLIAAGAQELIVYANVDADAGIERVRFSLDGTRLERGLIEPVGDPPTYPIANELVSTVATDVQNGAAPVFEYFDETFLGTGSPLAQPVVATDVRLVRMTLTVDDDPTSDPVASTLTTFTQLRNLKENY